MMRCMRIVLPACFLFAAFPGFSLQQQKSVCDRNNLLNLPLFKNLPELFNNVTPDGQPAQTIEMISLPCAGPEISLALAYSPGHSSPWTHPDGTPLLSPHWRFTLPCLLPPADEEDPEELVLEIEGTKRVVFSRQAGGTSYTSFRYPTLHLVHTAEDLWTARDREGNSVTFYGFTSTRPKPERGKPLAFHTPYFQGKRGAFFKWTSEGLLESITDSAGRIFILHYEGSRISWIDVFRQDELQLATISFTYQNETYKPGSFPGALVSVAATSYERPDECCTHVFRYHESGPQETLLAGIMTPQKVLQQGGATAARSLPDALFFEHAACSFEYRALDSAPFFVCSRIRKYTCSSCGIPANGEFHFSYITNSAPAGFNDWARQVIQYNPDGSRISIDFNRCHRVLHILESLQEGTRYQTRYTSCSYDQGGRLSLIAYPSEGHYYDASNHQGSIKQKGGFREGLVERFLYDDRDRLIEEQVGKTSFLKKGTPQSWITIRRYEYTDAIPWPSSITECPGNGSEERTTRFSYTFNGDPADLILTGKTTTLAPVSVEENGSGSEDHAVSFFDPETGQVARHVDAAGTSIVFSHYKETGLLSERTVDPQGLNLSTSWFYNPWGTLEKKVFPGGVGEVHYSCALREGKTAHFTYKTKGIHAIGPVSIVVDDLEGTVLCRAQGAPPDGCFPEEATAAGSADILEAWTGTFSNFTRSVYFNNQLWRTERVQDPRAQTPCVYSEEYYYDVKGRVRKTVDSGGTVQVYEFNAFDQVTRLYEGRDRRETGLTLKEKHTYDTSGNVISIRRYSEDPGDDEDERGSLLELEYDWRGRLVRKIFPDPDEEIRRARSYAYNNLDELIATRERPSGGDAWHLLSSREHDSRGRVWKETTVNAADPSKRASEYYWYSRTGQMAKTRFPSGVYHKKYFDAAGRLCAVYMGFDPGSPADQPGETYTESVTQAGLVDDIVIESESYLRDAAGNETLVTHLQRLPEAETRGVLSPATDARAQQTAFWYNDLGKETYFVIYGSRAPLLSERPPTVPFVNDTLLRTDLRYTPFGRLAEIVHPDGGVTTYRYDTLGRKIEEIKGAGSEEKELQARTVFGYDGQDRISSTRVEMPGPAGISLQETEYVYGVYKTGAYPSLIASGNLLREIRHSDPETGEASEPGSANVELFAYDAEGRVLRRRSCEDGTGNAVEHEYSYDHMGRLVTDSVSRTGAATDTAVQSIGCRYNEWGRIERIQAYSRPAEKGTLVNEIVFTYNGFGQITGEAQEHQGACGDETARVGYLWSETEAGDGLSRLSEVRYPFAESDRRRVSYGYGSADETAAAQKQISWRLGRIAAIRPGFWEGRSAASYSYTGLGTVSERKSRTAWPGFFLTQKTELDGFGRTETLTAGLSWNELSLLPLQLSQTGYDDAGRIKVTADRAVTLKNGEDQMRIYDGRGRLTTSVTGKWKQGILSDINSMEKWSLSGAGNWKEYYNDGEKELRRHNSCNQIVYSTGRNPITYDSLGNTTKAGDASYTYDAWNRLVGIASGAQTLQLERDGLGRVIKETATSGSGETTTNEYYYNKDLQVITMLSRSGKQSARNDYVWGVQHKDEIVLRHRERAGKEDTLLYIQDALRNVTTACNGLGLPVERYLYTPYGQCRIYSGLFTELRTKSAVENRLLFQGRPRYPVSGTDAYNFRHRAYAAALGRFLQKDPARLPYNHNLYAAPFGESWPDPDGLDPELRNCSKIEIPIMKNAFGAGLVIASDLSLHYTRCDCCQKKTKKWIIKGWKRYRLHGEASLGFGIAAKKTFLGIEIGFRVELMNFKFLNTNLKRIIDSCSGIKKNCVDIGNQVSLGVPVFNLSGLVVSVTGRAEANLSWKLQACFGENQKKTFNMMVCHQENVWIQFRLFWFTKEFIHATREYCIKVL